MARSGHVGRSGGMFPQEILKFRTLCGAFLDILGVVLLAVQRRYYYNAASHTHKTRTTCAYVAFYGSAQIFIRDKNRCGAAHVTSTFHTNNGKTNTGVRPERAGQTHRARPRLLLYRRSMSSCAAGAGGCRLSINSGVPISRPTLFHA